MTEQELLVQRFIDNELTPAERLRLIRLLAQDETLRRQVLQTEELLAATVRLPHPIVPADLTQRVLAQLPAPRPSPWASRWRQLRSLLLAPHVLRVNIAQALLAVALILPVIWYVGRPSPDAQQPASMASPEPAAVAVRLVLLQPDAQSVAVAGDFNGWNPRQTPLRRSEGGLWTVTLQLKPGRYHYMYVVDGQQWITDPFAAEASFDGFGAQNAILEVDEL